MDQTDSDRSDVDERTGDDERDADMNFNRAPTTNSVAESSMSMSDLMPNYLRSSTSTRRDSMSSSITKRSLEVMPVEEAMSKPH
eukprot:11781179-Heterocapsa_arctica.AAC.1